MQQQTSQSISFIESTDDIKCWNPSWQAVVVSATFPGKSFERLTTDLAVLGGHCWLVNIVHPRPLDPSHPLPSHIYHCWHWRYTCLLFNSNHARVQESDFEMKSNKLSTYGMAIMVSFSSRTNAHLQIDWAIRDQTKTLKWSIRPDDDQAYSPFGVTAGIGSQFVWISNLPVLFLFVAGPCRSQRKKSHI